MTTLEQPNSLPRPPLGILGRFFRSRRGLILLAAIALGLGAALNWSWLVAVGIAPLLIGVLPCAAMCALGLCMTTMAGRSSGSASAGVQSDPAAPSAQIRSAAPSCCSLERTAGQLPADAPEVR